MTRTVALLGAGLLALAAPPAPLAAEVDALAEFQRLEGQLFAAGFRLAAANAPFCRQVAPATGMLLHDVAAYGTPAAVRASLGLSGDIGVQAVAPGSPAANAGIKVNDTLLAIGPRNIAEDFPPAAEAWQRGEQLDQALSEAGAAGPLELTLAHPGEAPLQRSLRPIAACHSRFEVLDSSDDAWADGERVVMGRRWPPFAYDTDAFAASVAHELAHNILGHVAYFQQTGRKQALVRLSERDADRIMPWLLYNAGYDPRGAVRWMAQWGPKHGGGLLRKRTHDGWDERVGFIEAEIATLEAHIAREGWQPGEADWSKFFRSELADRLDEQRQ